MIIQSAEDRKPTTGFLRVITRTYEGDSVVNVHRGEELIPGLVDEEGKWQDTDLSSFSEEVQAAARQLWTPEVVEAKKASEFERHEATKKAKAEAEAKKLEDEQRAKEADEAAKLQAEAETKAADDRLEEAVKAKLEELGVNLDSIRA